MGTESETVGADKIVSGMVTGGGDPGVPA